MADHKFLDHLEPWQAKSFQGVNTDNTAVGGCLRPHKVTEYHHDIMADVSDFVMSFLTQNFVAGVVLKRVMVLASPLVIWTSHPTSTRSVFGLKLKPSWVMLLLTTNLRSAAAVCTHCKDSIVGCAGGDDCPLFKDLTANALIFQANRLGSTPKLSHLLPPEVGLHFSRPVCEAIVGIACAPAAGYEVDFDDAAYTTTQAVVQAATYGHCSIGEAACELNKRLEAATTAVAVDKIKGAIDSLKMAGDCVASTTQGVMAFVWAKASNIVPKRVAGVVKIVTTSSKNRASELSATLTRPATELGFFELIHLFQMVVIGLGLYSAVLVMRFLDDVVFLALRMGEKWQVSFELLTLYLREVDLDTTGLVTIANVFRRGGQDTLLAEARRNAVVFFRALAGNARPEGITDEKVKHNGRHNNSSTRPCVDYNNGKPCKRLSPDGTCQYAHKCNQYVSDKGPGGYCFAQHARCNGCDYPQPKKLTKPQA